MNRDQIAALIAQSLRDLVASNSGHSHPWTTQVAECRHK